MFDFSVLKESKAEVCVRCFSKEDAIMFVNKMIDDYPDKTRFWTRGETHWSPSSSHVDYFPYLNNVQGNRLLWDDGEYAEKHRCLIIDFSSLVRTEDLGECTISDVNIESFLM